MRAPSAGNPGDAPSRTDFSALSKCGNVQLRNETLVAQYWPGLRDSFLRGEVHRRSLDSHAVCPEQRNSMDTVVTCTQAPTPSATHLGRTRKIRDNTEYGIFGVGVLVKHAETCSASDVNHLCFFQEVSSTHTWQPATWPTRGVNRTHVARHTFPEHSHGYGHFMTQGPRRLKLCCLFKRIRCTQSS